MFKVAALNISPQISQQPVYSQTRISACQPLEVRSKISKLKSELGLDWSEIGVAEPKPFENQYVFGTSACCLPDYLSVGLSVYHSAS